MTKEKKLFYIFLAVHLVVWTLVSLIRTVMPTDALEGIYWGGLRDFGTPKHPPFFAWLAWLVYTPFKKDFFIYLVSQSFVVIGFIYIYKLSKRFLDELSSMLCAVILEGCWVYSYITCYYGFNPDVICLFLFPALAYYFLVCMEKNKFKDWLILGFLVGIGFLNKYQTAFIILPMFIWTLLFKRDTFKNIYFYIASLIAFILFLPHVIWLFKYDFFPFLYFEGELSARNFLSHITAPLIFLVVQFALIVGSLIFFAILKKSANSPFELNKNTKKEDVCFLLLMGILPCFLHLIMGFISGGTMHPRWGFIFWFMTGTLLFYFFPIKIQKKDFVFALKLAFVAMAISVLALGGLLGIEKNYRSRYPVDTLYNDFTSIWAKKYSTPLKYFGGYIEWTLPLAIYTKNHPEIMLDTFGYKSPWINYDDLKKSGIFVLDRKYHEVVSDVKKYAPHLENVEPVEYSFYVKNALGQKREYKIYYFMIPPEK